MTNLVLHSGSTSFGASSQARSRMNSRPPIAVEPAEVATITPGPAQPVTTTPIAPK